MICAPHRLTFVLSFLVMLPPLSHGGYFGASESMNTSASFDQQDNGFRVNFGTSATSWLDLEWSYMDFGYSRYNDPEFVLGDTEDDNDVDRYENILFGSQIVNDEKAEFSGISKLRTRGLSAGLKFNKPINSWMNLYARASLMAWEAESIALNIYAPRKAFDEDGTEITDISDASLAANLNPCSSLDFCRIEDTANPTQTWAVDFWYGYGFTIKPFDWLAIRAEYANITLNAIEFPKAKLESFSAGLEIHY